MTVFKRYPGRRGNDHACAYHSPHFLFHTCFGFNVMLFVLVFLYLAIKHVLTAHVWDVGYSRSRRRIEPRWWLFHWYQVALEAAITFPLYIHLAPDFFTLGTAMELTALTLCTMAERNASYKLMLLIHVLSEMCLLGTYIIIAIFIQLQH